MFNINEYIAEHRGQEVIVKLKIGLIKCLLLDVSRDGNLRVSRIKVLESRDSSLKEWEDRDKVVIRKDSIVAIFIE